MAHTIRFEYRSSEGYKPSYINGVHGGFVLVQRELENSIV